MTAVVDRRYTFEEFMTLPLEGRWELVDGELVEKKVGNRANVVSGNLYSILRASLQSTGQGTVILDCWTRCWPAQPARVRRPDVAFIDVGRLPLGEIPEVLRIAPTLAMESISPGNSADEIDEKLDEYFEAGVPLVWMAFERRRTLRVYRPDGPLRQYRESDTFADEPLLPGLSFRVADLFALPGQTSA